MLLKDNGSHTDLLTMSTFICRGDVSAQGVAEFEV